MRPVSRNDFVKQLYLSLALDHWLAVICLIGLSLFDAPRGVTEVLGMFLLFGIAAPLWLIGMSSSVLAFKRSWVIVLNIIGLLILPIAFFASIAVFNNSNTVGGPEDVQLLIQMALAAIAVAIGLNVLMYFVTLKREWG
jgi:fumarate reductase subunit D